MKEPVWLNREDVLAIHEKLLALHDGLEGSRDDGRLQSALGKPLNRFAYDRASLPELAASYAADIVLNHPFLDGNKRTGFIVAVAFLEINGCEFFGTEVEATVHTLALASGNLNEVAYAGWLGANAKRARLGIG